MIRLNNVVLPAPFGPTRAVTIPGGKSRLTSFAATTPPKRLFDAAQAQNGVVRGSRAHFDHVSFNSARPIRPDGR